jgi:hypothetical protein
MMTLARSRGVAGFVIDGAIRDVAAFAEADFPCYARAVIPRGPSKSGPGQINVPVSIGGWVVSPGDVVVGDQDGVVTFAPEVAPALLEAVRAQEAAEADVLESIRTGRYDGHLAPLGPSQRLALAPHGLAGARPVRLRLWERRRQRGGRPRLPRHPRGRRRARGDRRGRGRAAHARARRRLARGTRSWHARVRARAPLRRGAAPTAGRGAWSRTRARWSSRRLRVRATWSTTSTTS